MALAEMMKVHPAAELFPLMEEKELQALVDDISENGLREPIVTYKDQVLDGRGRMQACETLGLTPSFTKYEGDEPFAYSVSKNLIRRSLTASQKAAIAAIAREPLMKEATRRKTDWRSRDSHTGHLTGSKEPARGRSREIVADQFGVGHAQVGRAWAVKESDPDLFEKIKSGEVSVGAAHRQVTATEKPPEERRKGLRKDPMQAYTIGSKRTGEWAGAQKNKLVVGLSEMNGLGRAIAEIDFGMAAAVCTRQELQQWAEMAGRLSSVLRDVRQRLLEVTEHASEA